MCNCGKKNISRLFTFSESVFQLHPGSCSKFRRCGAAEQQKAFQLLKEGKHTPDALVSESQREGFEISPMSHYYRHRDTPSIVSWAVWTQWPVCVRTERRRYCCDCCGASPGWDASAYSCVRAIVCLRSAGKFPNLFHVKKTQRPQEEVATLHLMKVLKACLRETFLSYSNLNWACTNGTLWKSKPKLSLRNKARSFL